MDGQWVGSYEGTHDGMIVIDVDDAGTCFEGVAQLFPSDPAIPGTVANFATSDRSNKATVTPFLNVMDPVSAEIVPNQVLPQRFPNFVFPASATVEINRSKESLAVSWTTDIGTNGKADLPTSKAASPSTYTPEPGVKSWKEFKEFATELSESELIYRGQPEGFRLRTAFHRTRRKDALRFIVQDIPALHRHLSARTTHFFNLGNPLENGAFHNLIQHHGYPTPLLDWTYSPFVAAYLAFRDEPKEPLSENVRVLIFDKGSWSKDFNQLNKIGPAKPHFSVAEFLAVGNERMIPQAGLSTITNVDDVESYIASREEERGKKYLRVVDLPRIERRTVLRELAAMGLTQGSLFPGLDGACRELRDKFFGV